MAKQRPTAVRDAATASPSENGGAKRGSPSPKPNPVLWRYDPREPDPEGINFPVLLPNVSKMRRTVVPYRVLVECARGGNQHIAHMLLCEFASKRPPSPVLVEYIAGCLRTWMEADFSAAKSASSFFLAGPKHRPEALDMRSREAHRVLAFVVLRGRRRSARGAADEVAQRLHCSRKSVEAAIRHLDDPDKPLTVAQRSAVDMLLCTFRPRLPATPKAQLDHRLRIKRVLEDDATLDNLRSLIAKRCLGRAAWTKWAAWESTHRRGWATLSRMLNAR
jgi:hypothetical protein